MTNTEKQKLPRRLAIHLMKACGGDMESITVLQVIEALIHFPSQQKPQIASVAQRAREIQELAAKQAHTG